MKGQFPLLVSGARRNVAALVSSAADFGPRRSADRRVRTLWLAVFGAIVLLAPMALIFAGGGYVQFLSSHVVNTNASYYRWEPSSTVTSTWIHSWDEITSSYSFTGWTGFWDSATAKIGSM